MKDLQFDLLRSARALALGLLGVSACYVGEPASSGTETDGVGTTTAGSAGPSGEDEAQGDGQGQDADGGGVDEGADSGTPGEDTSGGAVDPTTSGGGESSGTETTGAPFEPGDCSLDNLDEYGGCRAISFNLPASDFFRTHFEDGRWWLVTPDNNAFLSFGLNHFHAGLWTQNYNQAHWEQEFGAPARSEVWVDEFVEAARSIADSINMNTVAYHNEDVMKERPTIRPYFRQYHPLQLARHTSPTASDYADVFAPEFVQTCQQAVQRDVAPFVDDPLIIGFVMNDIPIVTEGYAQSVSSNSSAFTWAHVLRNLGGGAPGKQAYVDVIRGRYANIAAFNNVYGTSFSSFNELQNTQNWRPNPNYNNQAEVDDNNAFNAVAIRQYYETAAAAFRAVDSNHLFGTDKINANLRDISELELFVEAIKDSTDFIMYQLYARPDLQHSVQDLIAAVAPNTPQMNGDGGFGAADDPNMPNPQTPTAANQAQRADWLYEYAELAFGHPHFIGYGLCGVIDSHSTGSTNRQKPGIMTPTGDMHADVIDALARIGKDLYDIKMSQ